MGTVSSPSSLTRTARPVEDVLALATRAPSIHNTQPWLWRVRGEHLDLFGDPERLLPVEDPEGRNLVISCGALLHHAQVAAHSLGWCTRVRRRPDPDNPWHLATLVLADPPPGHTATDETDVIRRRRTDRRRFTSWPVPEGRLNRLSAEGVLWGAQVFPVNGLRSRRELLVLSELADRLQDEDPAVRAEVARWRDGPVDGIPSSAIPVDEGGADPVDRLSHRYDGGTLPDPMREPEPTLGGLLLVCTWSDDAAAWLRAGEALSAIWLKATRDDLCLLPLSRLFEVPRTRALVRDGILAGLAAPQLLLRVGWPSLTAEPVPPTPRRPLADLLVD